MSVCTPPCIAASTGCTASGRQPQSLPALWVHLQQPATVTKSSGCYICSHPAFLQRKAHVQGPTLNYTFWVFCQGQRLLVVEHPDIVLALPFLSLPLPQLKDLHPHNIPLANFPSHRMHLRWAMHHKEHLNRSKTKAQEEAAHHIADILGPVRELHPQSGKDWHDGGVMAAVHEERARIRSICSCRHPTHNLQHTRCVKNTMVLLLHPLEKSSFDGKQSILDATSFMPPTWSDRLMGNPPSASNDPSHVGIRSQQAALRCPLMHGNGFMLCDWQRGLKWWSSKSKEHSRACTCSNRGPMLRRSMSGPCCSLAWGATSAVIRRVASRFTSISSSSDMPCPMHHHLSA